MKVEDEEGEKSEEHGGLVRITRDMFEGMKRKVEQ